MPYKFNPFTKKLDITSAGITDHGALTGLADDDHTQYLLATNNLSDLNNVATARTNLGLVAGGAGDIWVEKAGDTMTGNLILEDDVKLQLGTGLDGNIYVSSDDLYIENDTSDKDIIFKINDGGSDTEVMRIDGSTSRVGIGTTAPSTTLHVSGSGQLTVRRSDQVYGTIQNDDDTGYLQIWGGNLYNNGAALYIAGDSWAGSASMGAGDLIINQGTNGNIRFHDISDNEHMRITNAGNVGIGTTGPGALLDIQGTGFEGQHVYRFSADTGSPSINFRKSRSGTVGTNTIVQDGDYLGNLRFSGADGGSGYDTAAQITALVDGTPGETNDMPGALLFWTTPDGSGTTTERMRIDNAGNVGIGTTGPNHKLDVQGGNINLASGNKITFNHVATPATGRSILWTDDNGTYLRSFDNSATDGIFFQSYAGSNLMFIKENGNVGIGTTDPDYPLDVNGAIGGRELSADPANPDEGAYAIWQSDGTGTGADGDLLVKITAAAATVTRYLAKKSPPDYTVTNGSTDRAYDANATTLDEVADVLSTLIADLIDYGILQ